MLWKTAWTSSAGPQETIELRISPATGAATDPESARWLIRSDLLRTPTAFPLWSQTTPSLAPGRENDDAAACTVASTPIVRSRAEIAPLRVSIRIAGSFQA